MLNLLFAEENPRVDLTHRIGRGRERRGRLVPLLPSSFGPVLLPPHLPFGWWVRFLSGPSFCALQLFERLFSQSATNPSLIQGGSFAHQPTWIPIIHRNWQIFAMVFNANHNGGRNGRREVVETCVGKKLGPGRVCTCAQVGPLI